MKSLKFFLIAFFSVSIAWASGSTASGTIGDRGTRPTPNSFSINTGNKDWVKFNNIEGRKVEFYFKDRTNVSNGLYKVDVNEIDQRVIDALKKSQINRSWQVIPAEEVEEK